MGLEDGLPKERMEKMRRGLGLELKETPEFENKEVEKPVKTGESGHEAGAWRTWIFENRCSLRMGQRPAMKSSERR